ncbi:hypothetical protein D0A37_17335 [Microcoleus vaginatus HSN003]|nr:hypothetical protein D0A37_17335 [Microcoleus vaginatus HSN003]
MAGDGARIKDFSLRGRQAADGGRQAGERRAERGAIVSHLAPFSISLGRARSLAQWCQLKVKPIVRQGLKPLPQSESPLKED